MKSWPGSFSTMSPSFTSIIRAYRPYGSAGGLSPAAGWFGARRRVDAEIILAPMLTFVGRRLLQLVPTLFFVSVIIFSLQHLLPGDPALVMAGEERDPAAIEQIRRQYHLDRPMPVQYVYWIKGVLTGDLGESMRLKEPVLSLVLAKLPVTIQLASMAIVIALVIGIGAGIVSAVKKDSVWDYVANG